jgi:hypothetical protein
MSRNSWIVSTEGKTEVAESQAGRGGTAVNPTTTISLILVREP